LSLFSQKRFAGWSPAALMLAATAAYGSIRQRKSAYVCRTEAFCGLVASRTCMATGSIRQRTAAEQLQAERICTSSQGTDSRRRMSTSSHRNASRTYITERDVRH
jgi:hypothetical protein